MNTREITQAISELAANSIGVYAADHIPCRLSLPAAIVTNLDTLEKPGSHWVAFYIVVQQQVAPTLTALAWYSRHDGISIDSKEIANASNGTRKSCKASIRKYAVNIISYFCILCVVGVVYGHFDKSLRQILAQTTN